MNPLQNSGFIAPLRSSASILEQTHIIPCNRITSGARHGHAGRCVGFGLCFFVVLRACHHSAHGWSGEGEYPLELGSTFFSSSPDFFLEDDVRYFSNFHGAFLSTRLVVPYLLLIFGAGLRWHFSPQ